MSSELMSAMSAAATGLRAQTVRIRISAENLANADTTASTPGGDPYRRKAPVFRTYYDREIGADTVKVTGARARSAARLRSQPQRDRVEPRDDARRRRSPESLRET